MVDSVCFRDDTDMNVIQRTCRLVVASYEERDRATGEANAPDAMRDMMSELRTLPLEERLRIRHQLTDLEAALLFGVASDAAVDAIVERRTDGFADGLFALMVENAQRDSRDTLRRLSLLSHAAGKLRFDLAAVHRAQRHLGSHTVVELMDAWFSRAPSSIASMGYEESHDKQGRFIFRSTIGRGS
jgi:hypothetical protein